jgi:hypothetical protein
MAGETLMCDFLISHHISHLTQGAVCKGVSPPHTHPLTMPILACDVCDLPIYVTHTILTIK